MNFSRQGVASLFNAIFIRIKQNLSIFIASCLFLSSFFMPAYIISDGNFSGFECFKICILIAHDLSLESLYYLGFVFVNFAFASIVGISFAKYHLQMSVRISSIACVLYIASWAALNIFHEDSSGIDVLGIGYYAWLLSFMHLSFTLIHNEQHST